MGAGCRRVEQYNDDMLRYILAVGAAPGAGNRSHIADVPSGVDKEIHQGKCVCTWGLRCSVKACFNQYLVYPSYPRISIWQSLDTFRWRVYSFMMIKEVSLWMAFLPLRRTLVVKSDGTTMKVDEGKSIIVKKEIVARCLQGITE